MKGNPLIYWLTIANLLGHGLAYLSMGTAGFVDPMAKLRGMGVLSVSADGLTTFRVIYGGLMWAIATIFVVSSLVRKMHRFGLLALIIVMLSLVISRTIGVLLDGGQSNSHFVYSGIELAAAALAVFLYRSIGSAVTPQAAQASSQ